MRGKKGNAIERNIRGISGWRKRNMGAIGNNVSGGAEGL